jgi:hypothetical protein
VDDRAVVTVAPPAAWTVAATCTCSAPAPQVRATRKGAARTHCAHCGLPIRLDFESR